MRKPSLTALTLTLLLPLAAPVLAQDAKKKKDKITHKLEKDEDNCWYVTVTGIPTSVAEFKTLRNEMCKTPQGAMVCFIIAMHIYGQNEKLGLQCLPLILDKSLLDKTIKLKPKYKLPGYKGWQVGRSFDQKRKSSGFKPDAKYAAHSYVIGTSRENGYKLPKLPYKYYVRKHRVPPHKNEWKGFLNTSGSTGGGAVPYVVKKNSRGVWKMLKESSFFAGTADPPKKDDDDL